MKKGTSRIWMIFFFGYLALDLFASQYSAAASLTWQNVRPTVATRGIATNGSIYVSAAANGLFSSTDLNIWVRSSLPSGAGQSYSDVIWSDTGGEFIAVGLGTVLTSPDGKTWTIRFTDSSGLGVELTSVIYANGAYIAVGSDNKDAVALISPDAVSWQLNAIAANPSGRSILITGVAWGNGQYVVAGLNFLDQPLTSAIFNGYDVIYTSSDAINWVAQTLPYNGMYGLIGDGSNDVAFANNTFVAGGILGIYTSSDGVNWTAEFLPSESSDDFWIFSRIQAVNGTLYAVGTDVGNSSYPGTELAVFSSTDGVTWNMNALNQTTPNGLYSSIDAITTGGPGYIVAGEVGIATSPDATTWTFHPSSVIPIAASCIYFDHGVATVLGYSNYAVSSSDGTHWSAPTLVRIGGVLGGQGCMAANGTVFVAAGARPAVSTNGLTWSYDTISTIGSMGGVAYDGSQFYVVGQGNSPFEFASSDGKNWNSVSETGLPSDAYFGSYARGGLTAGGGKLVAWGEHTSNDQPFLAVTGNGAQWTSTTDLPATLTAIISVGYGAGTYIAICTDTAQNTLILTSTDALHWTQVDNLPQGLKGFEWGNISYGGGTWLISGTGGDIPGMVIVLTSQDGQHWALQNLGYGASLSAPDSAWIGSGFVVATPFDILEAPVSTGGSGGGGGSGSGSSSGGGSIGMFALLLLALSLTLRRRKMKLAG
jgi:hypothetical protein